MKKSIILAVSATTLTFFAATAWCDSLDNTNYPNNSNPTYSRDRDLDAASYHRSHRNVGELSKANQLIGMTVKNDNSETIGKVKDLALDLQNGRIVSVIVATGGFAGVDRKYVAVPPSLFFYDESKKDLRTTLDKSRLQNAPEFRLSDWKNNLQDTQVRESYQYYGVPTYYGPLPQSANDDATVNTANTATSVNPNSPLGNGKARDVNGQYTTNTPADNVVNTGDATSANPTAVMPKETYPDPAVALHPVATTNADGTVTWRNSGDFDPKAQVSTYYSFPSQTGTGTNDYDYYHSASYYDHQHPQNLGTVVSANKVIGATAYNNENEKLGKVENLIVDLHSGRIVEVILASGGFLGIDDQYTAVPPQSFQYNADDSRVTLEVTRDSLQASPHFKNSEWANANQPARINETYRAYHVEPYFTPATADVDNTARNVRDRSHETITSSDQGNSQSDRQMTAQIRKAVLQIDNLSLDARNVKIITINGHVTLRGVVNTEAEKRSVADAATRVSSDQIDNQLEVKGTTPISTDSAK